MRPLWVFGLVPLMLIAPFAEGGGGPDVRSRFSYDGPSSVVGAFKGVCAAAGAVVAPGALEVTYSSAVLAQQWTRVNVTDLDGSGAPMPDRQWSQVHVLGRGPLVLRVPAGATAELLPYGAKEGMANGRVPVAFDADRLDLSGTDWRADAPSGFRWQTDPEPGPLDSGFILNFTSFAGWNRAVSFLGAAKTESDVTLYLRETGIETGAQELVLDPWRTTEQEISPPGPLAHRTIVYADAFLDVRGASFKLTSGTTVYCGGLQGDVTGAFAADRATGSAEVGGSTVRFKDRVLSLEGRFRLDEDLGGASNDPGRVEASADGDIQVVGVDFGAEARREAVPRVAAVGFVALVAAAMLATWKWWGSLVGFLYSRIATDKVLDNGNRVLIFDAVTQNPGIDMVKLASLIPFHVSTVAYHLRVLHRAGLVERMRHGNSLRLFVRNGGVDRRRALLEHDESLRFIAERLEGGEMALNALVRTLRDRFGVTRQAAHLMVGRAVQRNVARRLGEGRKVVIRCAS